MNMMAQLINIIVLIAATSEVSHAFVPHVRPWTRPVLNSSKANVEAIPEENTSMTTLNLVGEVTKTSELVPSSNKKTLVDFFSLPESPNLILRGSANNQIVEIENPDASLLKAYNQQCKEVDAKSPTPNDKFYDVTTSAVKFPGLKVC